ncbi:MAG: DUF2270 domain-containing protein [Planctomycetes bacterium]|nr:DUF2270 domain-containing protein [Planctomycetota bacterium]
MHEPTGSFSPSPMPGPSPGGAGIPPLPPTKTQKLAKLGITWVQGNPLPADSTQGIIHLYRGEVGRETAWRQRLDTTTNWAIIATSAMISVAYGTAGVPHFLLPLGSFLLLLLLMIEARRYRYYDVWRSRTRLLEAHFFVPMLLHDVRLPQGDWRKRLADDLLQPSFKMSWFEAVAMRLKRNYIWLFLVLFLAWVGKIVNDVHPLDTFGDFYRALRTGPIPSWFYLAMTLVFHAVLVVLLILGLPRREREAAILKRVERETDWPV